jgi:hypothetical protein
MTVMWETSKALPSKVDYGPTPALGRSAEVTGEKGLHEVRLCGLKPATVYHYRVKSGPLASEVYTFRTAPPAGTGRWRMAVYGDSRSNPAVHRKVAEGIARAGVDLIVHTGDIVANGKNHDSWRKEFFEPLGPLARSVPWVSTIGNHERDADNYFSYMALPGNERYFGLDYSNAHVVCLDSNAWIARGRDSQQSRWLREHLAQKRPATWTFVVFHHPLFSAHATRPVNSLRWDWAPVLLDPGNHVDAVLTGHDHFFARNYRMGLVGDRPQPGVLFLTSAGGGAGLYRCTERDYTARARSVHHFVLFEFDGDRVTLTARDVSGKEVDRYVLTKEATPAGDFCAYEVEELRHLLRQALQQVVPVRATEDGSVQIDSVVRVPTRFRVPVSGHLQWREAPGWRLEQGPVAFTIEPGRPLLIPLRARVVPGAFAHNPTLRITFEPGRFRNRMLEVAPFQLGGPEHVRAGRVEAKPLIDGEFTESGWQGTAGEPLLGLPPVGGRGDRVRLLADRDRLYLGATLEDPAGKVRVKPAVDAAEGSRVVLGLEHVRLVLSDGQHTHRFALSPEQVRYHESGDKDEEAITWRAAAARARGGWTAEIAVPRKLFADWSGVRVNVVHRRGGKEGQELHLCPTYTFGDNPDRLPDCRPSERPARWARLLFE